jgi:hypothetical protein
VLDAGAVLQEDSLNEIVQRLERGAAEIVGSEDLWDGAEATRALAAPAISNREQAIACHYHLRFIAVRLFSARCSPSLFSVDQPNRVVAEIHMAVGLGPQADAA